MSRFVAKCALGVLALGAAVLSCRAQTARGATTQTPAVAYTDDGALVLASESGGVVRRIEAELPIGDFAISPDLKTVVFTPPHPGEIGGPLLILDVATGAIEPMMPDPYFNDDSVDEPAEFYSDPEFSADGRYVVFATHADGDGSDVQTSGPLAVLELATRKVRILQSTIGANGLPFGNMRAPHWSPDGTQILGNIEGHVFVTDAGGAAVQEVFIPESELSQSPDAYGMYGIGWLGAGCVLYQAGEDLERDAARIFRMSDRGTVPAAELLRLPEDPLRGLRGIVGSLRVRAGADGYRVEGPGIGWPLRGDEENTFVHLLSQSGASGIAAIPAACR